MTAHPGERQDAAPMRLSPERMNKEEGIDIHGEIKDEAEDYRH